jgi:LPXTG-motif cell wall-anchored protein
VTSATTIDPEPVATVTSATTIEPRAASATSATTAPAVVLESATSATTVPAPIAPAPEVPPVYEPQPQPVLPQTSSTLPALQLLGGLSLLGGFVVRRFRMRSGSNV